MQEQDLATMAMMQPKTALPWAALPRKKLPFRWRPMEPGPL